MGFGLDGTNVFHDWAAILVNPGLLTHALAHHIHPPCRAPKKRRFVSEKIDGVNVHSTDIYINFLEYDFELYSSSSKQRSSRSLKEEQVKWVDGDDDVSWILTVDGIVDKCFFF